MQDHIDIVLIQDSHKIWKLLDLTLFDTQSALTQLAVESVSAEGFTS